MTRDEVIALAKEAGAGDMGLNVYGSTHLLGLFERFASLVEAKAGKDTKRLDFLAETLWNPNPLFGYGNIGGNLDLPTIDGVPSESLRDAIDHAKELEQS